MADPFKQPVQSIYDFSDDALSELKKWIENSGLSIPISQLTVPKQTLDPGTVTAGDIANALIQLGLAKSP